MTGYSTRIEKVAIEYLKEHIDHPMSVVDRTIQGESRLKYRPDCMWAGHDRVIHFECDEHQHGGVSYSCDEKRMSDIYDEYPGKHVIWVRWNPDGYKPQPGCKKKRKQERLDMLVSEVNNAMTCELDTAISVVYMFYSVGNVNVSRNIKSRQVY